jgi:hypothetical protein
MDNPHGVLRLDHELVEVTVELPSDQPQVSGVVVEEEPPVVA